MSAARASGAPEGRRDVLEYYRDLAPYLDRELASRPDRHFWRDLAERHRGERTLEVGCGTGRVTELLLPAARSLVAVDLSPAMLARARRRLASPDRLLLIRADVCRLPLSAEFDLAVAANGVFSHLLEDGARDRALRQIARRLTTGGTFLLDGLWLSRERLRKCATEEGWSRERRAEGGGRLLRIREHWRCDPERRLCRIRYTYREEGGSETVARCTARYWGEDEISRRMEAAGLRVLDQWGGFDRRPWDAERSTRLVVRALRR